MLVKAYAARGSKKSPVVEQAFYKLPTDRTIRVDSKVHPMYTAGGNEALIDGILGTTNWRTGEWQSYFDTDFEAIIDLQTVKPIKFMGVHVLQDVSPWILYPREVIFYISDDGKSFTEAGRVLNKIDQKSERPETQELGLPVNLKGRYVKIKAVNGGKLPLWHESSGNPSHLFIDEVFVR
jgi:hypothetical protein